MKFHVHSLISLIYFVIVQETYSKASFERCGNLATWVVPTQNGFGSPHPAAFSTGPCVVASVKSTLAIGETTQVTLTGATGQGLKLETTLGAWSGNNAGRISGKCVDYDNRNTAPNGLASATFTASTPGTVQIRGLCATRTGPMMVSNTIEFVIDGAAGGGGGGGGQAPPAPAPADNSGNALTPVPISDALFWHIVTMIIGWGILIPLGVVLPLFNNIKYGYAICGISGPSWLKYHWILISIGCVFTFAGTITGIVEVGVEPDVEHFSGESHFQLGLLLLIASVLQPIHGFFRPPKSKNPTLSRKFFEYGHLTFGYLIVLLAIIENIIGIDIMNRFSTGGAPYDYNGAVGNVGFDGPLGVVIILLSAFFLLLLAAGLTRGVYNKYIVGIDEATEMVGFKRVDDDSPQGSKRKLTFDEIAAHKTEQSCWVIYNGKVYDCTPFLSQHPGGKKSIMNCAGKDMTKPYDDVGHSSEANSMLRKYYIGDVSRGNSRSRTLSNRLSQKFNQLKNQYLPSADAVNARISRLSMNANKQLSAFSNGGASRPMQNQSNAFLTGGANRQRVTLSEKTQISHNTFYLKFSFPNQPSKVLGLPTGKHISIYAPVVQGRVRGKWNGQPDAEGSKMEISRKFTPVSCDANDVGYFSLIVKMYRPSKEFVDGGRMSRYLESLRLGSQIEISGPFGSHEYVGLGRILDSGREILFRECAMVCGGSGITPCIQIATAILRNKNDRTRISMIYSNTSLEDTLMLDYLKNLEKKDPNRFRLWFTISKDPRSGGQQYSYAPEWEYSIGRINRQMFRDHLPKGSNDCIAITCGPRPMMDAANRLLREAGYSEERIVEY